MTQEALNLAIQLRDTASGYWTENEIPIIEKLIEALAQTELCKHGQDPKSCTSSPMDCQCAIDASLAQTQEPVGDEWTPCMKLPVVVYVRKQRLGEAHISTREGITPVKPDDLIMRGVSGEEYPIGRAIFEQTYSLATTPPQRTWVGLTDEKIDKLRSGYQSGRIGSFVALAQAIEAKLKEKNT
jgi:hypothetical protein